MPELPQPGRSAYEMVDRLGSPGGVRVLATVALAGSMALLFVDAGQPDVRLFRIGLAAWGIGGAAAALMRGREDFQ